MAGPATPRRAALSAVPAAITLFITLFIVSKTAAAAKGICMPATSESPPDISAARERLRELFRQRAIQFGEFTLASGQKSRYYIDSKQVLFHSEALYLLGECLYAATADLAWQAIGGLEVGAIPLTAATLLAYQRRGLVREGFFVRKQAKEHGSRNRLEGRVRSGDAVIVVDDVVTTGASTLQAIEAVEAAGGRVVRAVCICDRLQGAAETLGRYDFRPLFTVRDFGIEPEPPDANRP